MRNPKLALVLNSDSHSENASVGPLYIPWPIQLYAMSMGLDKEDLLYMSRVKSKVGVIFLSDMVTADRKHLETFAYDSEDLEVPQSKFRFQEKYLRTMTGRCGKTFGVNTQWRTSNFTRPWEPGFHAHA